MASNLATIKRRPRTVRPGHQVCAPIVACVAAENEIDGRSCLGIAPAADGELGVAESSGARHAVEMRASRLLEARIRFVGHPDFDDATAAAKILGPMPGPVGRGKHQAEAGARENLPLSDADLQDSTLLTREQEVHLFRRMNFSKYQAARLRNAINLSRVVSADLDRIEDFLQEAGAIRNRIIRSNLGLVAYIVRKYSGPCQDFLDLVSEGNVSLIQAAERFDFGRGNRFSTYATWAIINGFARRIPRDRSLRVRFATGCEEVLRALADHRDCGRADATDQESSREIIGKVLRCLDDRERTILVRRFGIAGDKRTLVQVGRELGISKERVRQIETRALGKLRALAEVRKLDLIDELA